MSAQQAAMQRARAEQQGRPGISQHPGQPLNGEQHDNMMMYQQHQMQQQQQQQQIQAQQQAMLRAQSNSSPMMPNSMPQGRPGSPGMHMQHIGPHGK